MHGFLTAALWTVFSLCILAVVYPYAIYPLLLRFLPVRPVKTQAAHSDSGREFALLFSSYNEAGALSDKLSNTQRLLEQFPDLEILAYDDCSSDGTPDILERAELGIRVIRGRDRHGKAHGMKLLASLTDREFLIFTDANVELDPGAVDALLSDYADPDVGGVCGVLRYRDTDTTMSAKTGGLYWRIDEAIKSLESRSGNVMGAAGAVFSIRNSLYPDFPDTVLDDLTVSMAVVFAGRRLIEDPRVLAHEPMVAARGDDIRRRVRISTRAFHTHLWLRPQLRRMSINDRWRYWSHRYIRWFGAFFIALGCMSGAAALGLSTNWLVAASAIGVTAIAIWAGTLTKTGPLSSFSHILMSIMLTGLGIIRAGQGRTMATWNPPAR
jgi:cellulose synthase/poly-beta-1,6-N-acetylglucosamine synthase-like glycosyltransferase